jgi:DNA polymerase-1
MTTPKRLYIDADVLLYRASFASQNIDPMTGSRPDARELFDGYLQRIIKDTGIPDYSCCLSSRTNFRKELFPGYKANRKSKPKPEGLSEIRGWVLVHRRGWTVDGLEADDLLGIVATSDRESNAITSIDKDMRTIPDVRWWNFYSGEWEHQTREEAQHFFLVQVLAGDPTDGYKGVPGIGPKKAEKILEAGADWSTVVNAYHDKGLTEDDALISARMAHILTCDNFNIDDHYLTQWEPRDLVNPS